MPEQSANPRNTTATVSASVPAIDNLPPELLETILGCLDVRTLCTARLVCSQFHGAASRCIHSVELSVKDLRSQPETTLNNFPNLSRVSVVDVDVDDLLMLAHSPLGDAVTHLLVGNYMPELPEPGQIAASLPILPLPNLVSFTVCGTPSHAFSFPQTLRELSLEYRAETLRAANLAASLTSLTCLRIDVGGIREPFEAVTALTGLQKLEITCSSTLIPCVAKLTLLTHLHLREMLPWDQPSDLALASLPRLQKLVHLGVGHHSTSEEFHQLVASIGTITSLRSLHLHLPGRSALGTVCVAPFSQLTALRLDGWDLDGQMGASFLARFNMERLQDLSLNGVELHREGVVALGRATGLTHLELGTVHGLSVAPEELGAALARMSRLRALSFSAPWQATGCSKAIAPLTELTRLYLCEESDTTNAVAEVCLGLKNLRVLSLAAPWSGLRRSAVSDPISPEAFLAIAKLPELSRLELIRIDVGMLELRDEEGQLRGDLRAWLDAERHEKGWPPLDIFF